MFHPDVFGSLTKEPPLAKLDATLKLVTPGITYEKLRQRAAEAVGAHPDAPRLLVARYLSLDSRQRVEYDGLLSLIAREGVVSPKVRKVMYLVWVWRDSRIRRFVLERLAGPDGRWKADEVTNKANADFFEDYGAASSSTKVRSNLEYYLTQSRLFDAVSQRAKFDLADGWLDDAMGIVARSVRDARLRREMVDDPVEFLYTRNLNGLISHTAADRPSNPNPRTRLNPVPDLQIPPTSTSVPHRGVEWTTGNMIYIGGAVPTEFNGVAHERANRAHLELEQIAAAGLRANGMRPMCNPLIDMYVKSVNGAALFEMKSCHVGNIRSQVRRGLSQLLEYRYLHRTLLTDLPILVLVLETEPIGSAAWLSQFLISCGVLPVWRHAEAGRLATSARIPSLLHGVVSNG